MKKLAIAGLIALSATNLYARDAIMPNEQNTLNKLQLTNVVTTVRNGMELNRPLSAIDTMSLVIKHGNILNSKLGTDINRINDSVMSLWDYNDEFAENTAIIFESQDQRLEDLELQLATKTEEIDQLKKDNNTHLILIILTALFAVIK